MIKNGNPGMSENAWKKLHNLYARFERKHRDKIIKLLKEKESKKGA